MVNSPIPTELLQDVGVKPYTAVVDLGYRGG